MYDVVYGEWRIVCDVWCVVNGLWPIAYVYTWYSVWCIVHCAEYVYTEENSILN